MCSLLLLKLQILLDPDRIPLTYVLVMYTNYRSAFSPTPTPQSTTALARRDRQAEVAKWVRGLPVAPLDVTRRCHALCHGASLMAPGIVQFCLQKSQLTSHIRAVAIDLAATLAHASNFALTVGEVIQGPYFLVILSSAMTTTPTSLPSLCATVHLFVVVVVVCMAKFN